MIVIIATVCSLLAGPNRVPCKDIQLSFAEENIDGSPASLNYMGCFLYGQLAMNDWQQYHPNWLLAKWHCETKKPGEQKADL